MKNHSPFLTYEDAYTPKYCQLLELGYGHGLMAEGGHEGIEHMFDGVSLKDKSAIDIGAGLGGVAFYLATKYQMQITGVEVNRWLVDEATKRIPTTHQQRVNFILTSSNSHWPFAQGSRDIIYSKGVLAHVENKQELFQECHRILKEKGLLIITDWLSFDGTWGKCMLELIEAEKLTLFPTTEKEYVEALKNSGFKVLSVQDDTSTYIEYNQQVIRNLEKAKRGHRVQYNEADINATKAGIVSTIEAFEAKELRAVRFIATK